MSIKIKNNTRYRDVKVGDKVRIKHDTAGSPLIGKIGTVVAIIPWKNYPVIVKFDHIPSSMLFTGTLTHGKNTRQFSYNEIEKVKDKADVYDLKVVVKEDAVIAILKDDESTKKGIARCHPEDEFDMHTGLQIALSRLFDKPMPLLNGTELTQVNIHSEIDRRGVRGKIELKTDSNTYVMPIKTEV